MTTKPQNARELFESCLSQLFVEGGSDWVETNLSSTLILLIIEEKPL